MSFRTKWESLVMELKGRHDEICKENFFDVQIHCRNIILPAHRYVLSSSSLYLAEQLASGVDKLNWTEFDEPTCIAMLRWIYTNKVVFSPNTDVTAEQWQGLLLASYKLELVSLFTVCEEKLVPSLIGDDSSHRSGPFLRLNSTSKKVSANQLIQKCSKPRLSVNEVAPEEPAEPKAKISKLRADSDCSGSENCSDDRVYEQMAKEYRKFASGYDKFQQFSDLTLTIKNHVSRVHLHVLGNRSKKIVEKLRAAKDFNITFHFEEYLNSLLRWIYTDCIVFEDNDSKYGLLKASQFYELPALFERCEDALVEQVDIRSCGYYHQIAVEQNASKLFKRCTQVIAKHFNQPESPDCFQMDYEHRFDDSLNQRLVSESSTEVGEGLLTLNDDCLLHIFRFVSVADLGSIKDTCKRLSSLADRSFRIRKDKSLKFSHDSMFADIWILKHFGKFIKSLDVESFYERYTTLDDVLKLIAQCTGEELKSISIGGFLDDKESNNFECLETVMKTVECIELQWFQNDTHVNSLLGFCENLKEVCVNCEGIELNSAWCLKNPNVTKLTLDGLEDDSILKKICKMLPRLENLSLVCTETHTNKIFHLGQLSHLKKLKVESSMIGEALQKFTNKTVLEDLTLTLVTLTGSLANVLGEFANLSNLVFESCEHFDDNVRRILSEKLINIKTMTFDTCEYITSNAIMKIIENLLRLKSISITDCDKVKFIDRDDYLRLVKTRNLQILLDDDVHRRSCELIGNNFSSNVQLKLNQYSQ